MTESTHVRVPPPRPYEGVRVEGRMVCPVCGADAGLKRGWWHSVCAEIWNLTRSRFAWFELRKQTGDRCWLCGHEGGTEVDHRRPLYSLTAEERRELKWWLPFNQQLLCRSCHHAKSAHEAAERAALRRASYREPVSATSSIGSGGAGHSR